VKQFLQSCISSKLPNRPTVTNSDLKNIPIITAKDIHKDEINRVGASRFAHKTGQTLAHFYSDNSLKVKENLDAKSTCSKTLNIKEISDDIQHNLWHQPPSTTDKQIAGKLSLCYKLPVMICHNFATELCITRGQESYVHS